jgi:peptide/nickel transport system substrate-binding protein
VLFRSKRIESAEVTVLNGLPIQKTEDWVTVVREASIPVPTDAWVDWDATTQQFITAGMKYPGGLTARVKVVVTYPDLSGIKWHDGSSFSVADVVMYMIMGFDRAKPESVIYDETAASVFNSLMSSFKGVRIISTDPLTIESYTDMISLDVESLVSGYNGWGGGFNFTWWPDYSTGEAPWHMIAAGVKAETEGLLAFSAEKSSSLGIEPTNYIAGPALDTLKNKIDESAASGYIPYLPTLGAYITSTEAKDRWTNYQDWFATHQHLWVGSGPYFLDEVDPVNGLLVLKWTPVFLDPASKWNSLINPLEPPTVVSPETGAIFPYRTVLTIAWSPVAGATEYSVYWEDMDGKSLIGYRDWINDTSVSTGESLDAQYHWHVKARDSFGNESDWSPWFYFTVLEP